MDLKDFLPKGDTLTVNLVNPTTNEPLLNKDGSPMTIELYTKSSGVTTHALRDIVKARLEASKDDKGKEVKLSEEDEFHNSLQEKEAFAIEYLTKLTKSWNITWGDVKPKFSFKRARSIYSEASFLRDQLEEAIEEDQDFIKA